MDVDNREFIIPRHTDELQEFVENQYSVREIYSLEQVKDQYLGCRTDLEADGADFIQDKFELMYGCLIHFQNVSWKVIHELWEVSLEGMRFTVGALSPMLHDEDDIDDQLRKLSLRRTKMMVYVFTELMVRCEERTMQEKATAAPQKGKRKPAEADNQWNWSHQKSLALTELYKLVKLPLNLLWSPANISADFLDQMSRVCLKLLEDREIGFVNKKPMRDSIFQILSILCKEYIFGLSLMPKIVQMLMLFEHLSAPLAQSVAQLEETEGSVGMLGLALQELNGDMDLLSKAGHNCSQFLLELGRCNPQGVCKHLPLITEHLTREPYSMRNGVLELIGHLLLKVYSEENLTEKQIKQKDMLFECLTEHLSDLTAFCRSKTLQVWKDLCEEEVIPKPKLLALLVQVQQCILDKSSNTRKDAIKLMKTVLEHNPFAARLHSEEIEQQLAQSTEHLRGLEGRAGMTPEDDAEVFWSVKSKDISKVVRDILTEEARKKLEGLPTVVDEAAEEDAENTMVEGEDDIHMATMQQQLTNIGGMLRAEKYEDSVVSGLRFIKKFDTRNVLGVVASQNPTQQTQQLFAPSDDDEEEEEDEEGEDAEERARQRRLDKRIKMVFELMHMGLLAQEHQLEQHRPEVTPEMKAEITQQKEYVTFLKESLMFSQQIHLAVDKVLQVLEVSQTTDLVEAIDFIASAQQFGLLSEDKGMTRLLGFVHSKDVALKSSITNAYKKIYLYAMNAEAHTVTHEHVTEAMKKVCLLVQLSPSVYEHSLKQLVQLWVSSADINKECIDVLWEMVTGKKREDCISSMDLLHMVLQVDPAGVQDHLIYLERFGFGKRGEELFELAKNACKVLAVARPKPSSEAEQNPFKLSKDHGIFVSLSKIITDGLPKLSDSGYCDMVAAAMKAIFKVCDRPIDLVSNILESLYENITDLEKKADETVVGDTTLTEATANNVVVSQAEEGTQEVDKCDGLPIPQSVLLRLLEVLSCSMQELLTFLMEEVLIEMRRQRNLADKEKEAQKKHRSMPRESGDESEFSDTSIMNESKRIASYTEEEALDKIAFVCNNEILSENSIFGAFLPLIEEICMKPKVYSLPGLQVCAIQAMSSCMMMSEKYCTEKIRLFCTLMVKGSDAKIRIAAIHSMADLLARFPNETDPYSPNLYECLKDPEMQVRKEVLVILCKLILSDMLRVKFHISYLAACLTDPEPACRDVANYFFATLATKGNILYNLVLDMISQLSSEDSDKNQKEFETIMRVILPYIDKERQVVALVEKLCSRFPEKTTEQECHNIVLCISILPVSQKSMRALKDCFNFYADKLKFVTVKLTFDSILQTARKHFKGESKEFLEDFQDNLEKCCDPQAMKETLAQMAEEAAAAAAANKAKGKSTRKPARKKKATRSESSEESDTSTRTGRRGRGKAAGRRKVACQPASDEESGDESDTTARTGSTTASRRTTQRQTKRTKQVTSEEDDDSAFDDEVPKTPIRKAKAPAKTPAKAKAKSKVPTKTPAKTPARKQTRKGVTESPEEQSTNPRRSGRTTSR